ncbi:MAG: hypothetical protein RJA99_1731 [Pseudomonadota bacterium]|jgi:hypothetical protein
MASKPCKLRDALRCAGKPPVEPRFDDLVRNELAKIINMRHELVRLSEVIDWAVFDRRFGAQFVSATGRPAQPTRRVAGLLYLKHLYALSANFSDRGRPFRADRGPRFSVIVDGHGRREATGSS